MTRTLPLPPPAGHVRHLWLTAQAASIKVHPDARGPRLPRLRADLREHGSRFVHAQDGIDGKAIREEDHGKTMTHTPFTPSPGRARRADPGVHSCTQAALARPDAISRLCCPMGAWWRSIAPVRRGAAGRPGGRQSPLRRMDRVVCAWPHSRVDRLRPPGASRPPRQGAGPRLARRGAA
jgi:hypothetical protein